MSAVSYAFVAGMLTVGFLQAAAVLVFVLVEDWQFARAWDKANQRQLPRVTVVRR